MCTAAQVRRLLTSHACAAVGMSLIWPLLLLLVWQHTHSELLLGLTAAARLLPYVLFSWATGRLADRFRRGSLVRVTLVLRLALLGAMAGALARGDLVLAVVSASATIAVATPAFPALAAAMPAAAGGDRSRRATDLLVTIEVASFSVGPAMGGLLLAPSTRAWTPWAAVTLTALAAVLMLRVDLPTREISPQAPSPHRERARSGGLLLVLRERAEVRRAIIVIAIVNAMISALELTLLPLTQQAWATGAAGFGIATAALGFGALGAPLLRWVRGTARSRTRAALLLTSLPLLVVTASPGLWVALLPLALVGAASVLVEGATTETIQVSVPDAHRAGLLGLTDSIMIAAALVGSLAAPGLAGLLGTRVLTGALALGCLLPVLLVRKVRRRATTPAHAAAPEVALPRQRTRSPESEVAPRQPAHRR